MYDPTLDDEAIIEELRQVADDENASYMGRLLGIAANQIGIETRILLYRDDLGDLQALRNPEIVKYQGLDWTEFEGCGSLPDYECAVRRPWTVKVSQHHSAGYHFHSYFSGWESRIIQHEVDHLNGILIFDREVLPPDATDHTRHQELPHPSEQ